MLGVGVARDVVLSTTGLLTGVLVGIFTTKRFPNFLPFLDRDDYETDDDDDETDTEDDGSESGAIQKMVFCVRTDLKMQTGKIAAQVGHATLGGYKAARRKHASNLRAWERQAQPKITLQVPSAAMLQQLERNAKALNLTTFVVRDAGRTQIAAGSITVLAVGPGDADKINQVTGKLKLL